MTKDAKGKIEKRQEKVDSLLLFRKGQTLASRFNQLKTGHCLTGQYLARTKNRPITKYWCPYLNQTRKHLFKCCPHWRRRRKVLWAEV